jgi:CMP-N,N'-diacetyllegionaminic acid synthase
MSKKTQNVVAIILARGGSKGLINKNILPLDGKPLIAYTIEAAKQSKLIDKVVVSTDNEKIKNIALSYGAEVPFLRPKKLADDDATSEVALKHAAEWLIENENYTSDIIVYLQITDVFRSKTMIDQCVQALIDEPKLDTAFMGLLVHKNFWRKVGNKYIRLADDIPYGVPRQKREPLYREDTGLALASRLNVILDGKRIGDNVCIIPYEQKVDFIDIHSQFELRLSELLITKEGIIPND